MTTFEDVTAFLLEFSGCRKVLSLESTLQRDVGMYGDDMHEFLDAYSQRFNVDMSSYLWYFHTGEEGQNIGGLFFPPPNARVAEVPITLQTLVDAAERGSWPLQYPEHSSPARRYDILINKVLVGLSIAALVACLLLVAL